MATLLSWHITELMFVADSKVGLSI